MKKLLYILPEYDAGAHTHFSYIPPFLEAAAQTVDITLIVERGSRPKIPGIQKIVLIRPVFLKSVLLPLSILMARMRGTKVAYVHYSFLGAFFASIIFRLTGGSVYYWNCGLPWQYERGFMRSFFETMVYRLVTHVVTGTEKLADRYAEEYVLPRKKVLVMPNWIDLKETERKAKAVDRVGYRRMLKVPEDQKIVFFAHRLSERKGAQYLPEIARQLPPEATLVIVGDGPLLRNLMEKIIKENLQSKVRFFGWKPHEEVLDAMASSDLFIMPSDEEGFPHVLLEAMALSIPFVATSVGGVPEIVPPGTVATLIQKGDVGEFSAAVVLALMVPEDIRAMWVKETRKWVEQYDRGAILKRFLKLTSLS